MKILKAKLKRDSLLGLSLFGSMIAVTLDPILRAYIFLLKFFAPKSAALTEYSRYRGIQKVENAQQYMELIHNDCVTNRSLADKVHESEARVKQLLWS